MHALIRRLILPLCLLGAVSAAWAAPGRNTPAQAPGGAPARVVEMDRSANTVTLRLGNAPRAQTYEVSPTCVFEGGIGSLADLRPNMHVLVWTRPGQAGKLPILIRITPELR